MPRDEIGLLDGIGGEGGQFGSEYFSGSLEEGEGAGCVEGDFEAELVLGGEGVALAVFGRRFGIGGG